MRKNKLFPRQVSDIGAFLFVVLMMPATYIYETAVVVPAIYETGKFRFELSLSNDIYCKQTQKISIVPTNCI